MSAQKWRSFRYSVYRLKYLDLSNLFPIRLYIISSNDICLPVPLTQPSSLHCKLFQTSTIRQHFLYSLSGSIKDASGRGNDKLLSVKYPARSCPWMARQRCVLSNSRILCSQDKTSYTAWDFHYLWKGKKKTLQWVDHWTPAWESLLHNELAEWREQGLFYQWHISFPH